MATLDSDYPGDNGERRPLEQRAISGELYHSHSAEQTRQIGFRLGSLLEPGDVICLIGDLGAGKTTLVQGLCAGWGSRDAVSSPTFVLVNVYRKAAPAGEQRLFHLDAYRLSGPQEAEDLDLDALMENGPLVIEWADRIQGGKEHRGGKENREVLPEHRLWVTLQWVDEEQRDLIFKAYGPRYSAMITQLFGAI